MQPQILTIVLAVAATASAAPSGPTKPLVPYPSQLSGWISDYGEADCGAARDHYPIKVVQITNDTCAHIAPSTDNVQVAFSFYTSSITLYTDKDCKNPAKIGPLTVPSTGLKEQQKCVHPNEKKEKWQSAKVTGG